MLGPLLRGELISLEPSELSDLDTFRGWFADLEVTERLLMRFVPSAQQEQQWYDHVAAAPTDVHWKIVREGRTIGTTGIHTIDHLSGTATTGTIIGDRSQHGHGFGTEVVRLRTAYAFEELNLHRLETESFADNIPMHRCLEKAAYQCIGRRREFIFRAGRRHDGLIFELLRGDWEKLRK